MVLATKICTRCFSTLPATEEFFYKDKRLSDGLYCHCKSCHATSTNKNITRICYIAMVQRCLDPRAINYRYYGAKGIRVCERWLGKDGLTNFIADMGERPSKRHSIGRRGDVGDYCKENCSWQTKSEQVKERRKKVAA